MVTIGIAMILAAVGLTLAYRSRPEPIWRGLCPQCEESLWLPLRVCPFCETDLESKESRKAITLRQEEVERGKRALLRSSQIFILLAWIVLVIGFSIEIIWP
jgi:hypothetical protein